MSDDIIVAHDDGNDNDAAHATLVKLKLNSLQEIIIDDMHIMIASGALRYDVYDPIALTLVQLMQQHSCLKKLQFDMVVGHRPKDKDYGRMNSYNFDDISSYWERAALKIPSWKLTVTREYKKITENYINDNSNVYDTNHRHQTSYILEVARFTFTRAYISLISLNWC
jgi:hypothetical protein